MTYTKFLSLTLKVYWEGVSPVNTLALIEILKDAGGSSPIFKITHLWPAKSAY